MLDSYARPVASPFFDKAAAKLLSFNLNATHVTLIGLMVGFTGLFAVALGAYIPGLVLLLANRFLDGADGAVARATQITRFGAFLDRASRWIVHAGFVLFFSMSLADQSLASIILLFTYMLLAVSATDNDAAAKPAYALSGIVGETEMIAFMVLACLFPQNFAGIAALFALLCAITGIARLFNAAKTLR